MIVNLKIAAEFRYYVPNVDGLINGLDFELPKGSTLENLLQMAGFPEGVITIPIVNGHHAKKDKVLKGNDQIFLLHPMSGG